MHKRSNFYPNGEIIDYSLPQSFQKSLKAEACGNCGLYSNKDHSVVVGVLKLLKIITYATNGEKGSLRDSFVIFMPHG
jgi:hypothetical protein